MNKLCKMLFAALLLCASTTMVKAQTPEVWRTMKAPVTFLLGNDLGRNGYYDQKTIAETMGEVADVVDPEAVLAAGDIHHFQGVESVNDPLWMTNYELIYKHPELMISWYPVLGNHEYRGNTQAVLDYSNVSRRWQMPSRYYTKVIKNKNVTVRLVMIDTTPIIEKYRQDSETYPDAVKQDYKKQLNWIDSVLTASKEDWTIVVGHHPIHCATTKSKDEQISLQERLEPILKKHNVDLYACGHIHNFQYIKVPGSKIDYFVNSAGSLSRKVEDDKNIVFKSDKSGFSVLSASKDKLDIFLLDKDGNIIKTITRRK